MKPPEEPFGGLLAPPEAETPTREEREGRSVRRMMKALLLILAAAAIALLVILFWLLRPQPGPSPEAAAGYPIQVVRSIYGFGTDPADRLLQPLGVAFDEEGRVWISDTGHSRVLVFTEDGDLAMRVGEDEGPGKLFSPYGITMDPDRDRVYVADWTSGLVKIYSNSGAYIEHWPADDQKLKIFGPNGFSPYDVAVLEGRVIVSSNDGLYFFDSTGHVVARWGGEVRGVDLGMFNFPDSIEVDPDAGRVYVADTMNRRIVALDRDGRWLWVSGKPDKKGKIKGFWQLPRSVQLGPDGNLYVVDTFRFDKEGVGTGHFVVLNSEGRLVSEFGRAGMEEDSFNFPEQLALRPDGLWAIADRETGRVLLFRLLPIPEPEENETQVYEESLLVPEDVWATTPPEG